MEKKFDAVISGVSARIPECDNHFDFMEKIYNKASMTGIDTGWPKGAEVVGVPYFSGRVKNVQSYDYNCFGLSSYQIRAQVPITIKLLEMAYEAIVDAGVNPKSLSGTNCAVYMNAQESQLVKLLITTSPKSSRSMVGGSKAMASNRISFCLNLIGPSITLDSGNGCIFSLLRRAVEEIQEGRIESCLIGGSDFIYDARSSCDYLGLDVLAKDGDCRPFDNDAHGTVRSEGGVVFFLQRSGVAKRHRAVPVGFDYKYLGFNSLGLLHPDPGELVKMLSEFYAKYNIDPCQVKYIEADGSGIKIRDELELNLLTKVFTENRNESLQIGSLTGNVGYCATSSGLWNIFKILMIFETNTIPPTRNHTKANCQSSSLLSGKIKVVTENTELEGDLCAVDAFQISLGFAHGLLRRPPPKKKIESEIGHHLWFLSARTEKGLTQAMDLAVKTHPTPDFTDLLNGVFHKQMQGHLSRGVMIMEQESQKCVFRKTSHADSSSLRPLWFVFSGMGAQCNGMGTSLMKIPIFAEVIERCHTVLEPLGMNLKYILTDSDPNIFNNILNSFVGITTMQIGLIEVLRKMGLQADNYVGHSLGELCCAYADNCLTLEEAVLCSYARGKASIESTVIHGMMAAVGMGYKEAKDKVPPSIEIACHNSANSCTLSGPTEDVQRFVADLQKKGFFAKAVSVSNIAFHSKYIIPIGERLLKYLKEIVKTNKKRSEKWISSSVPRGDWMKDTAINSCPEYYANNLLGPVLFEEAIQDVPADAVILEIAPQGLLLPILKRAFPGSVTCVSLTPRNARVEDSYQTLLETVGSLYLRGYEPDPRAIYPAISYPVAAGTPNLSSFLLWDLSFNLEVPIPNEVEDGDYHIEKDMMLIKLDNIKHLFEGHILNSRATIPVSFYIKEIWRLYTWKDGAENSFELIQPLFKDIRIKSQVVLDETPEDAKLFFQLSPCSGRFEVSLVYRKNEEEKTRGDVVVSGFIFECEEDITAKQFIHEPRSVFGKTQDAESLRRIMQFKGYNLSPDFFSFSQFQEQKTVSNGRMIWKNNWQSLIDGAIKTGLLFDLDDDQLSYPTAIRALKIQPEEFKDLEYGMDMNFTLDKETGLLAVGEGLLLEGLVFGSAPSKSINTDHISDCKKFLPFFYENFPTKGDFMDAALDILTDSYRLIRKDVCDINVVYSGNTLTTKESDLLSILRKAVQNCGSKVNLLLNNSAALNQNLDGTFVKILSDNNLKSNSIQSNDISDNCFVLFHTEKLRTSTNVPGYFQILKYEDENMKYILFKKKCIKKNQIFEVVSGDWSDALKKMENISIDRTVNLIWEKRADINPSDIIEEIKSNKKIGKSCRCIFIMDENSPTFHETNPFYADHLRYGFSVNVLRNGLWGTLRTQTIPKMNRETLPDVAQITRFKLNDIDIHFVGLNTQARMINNNEHQFHIVEYSGITKDRKRVMGIAHYQSKASNLEIIKDPKLVWEIPSGVSLEDAATLPLAYSMATYAIRMSHRHYNRSALIFDGGSPIGFVTIAVALLSQFEIYTTVSNPEERKSVKQSFPQIKDANIIDCTYESIRLRLLFLTGGAGVDVVVGDIPEKEIINLWDCVAQYGQMIDSNEQSMMKNFQLPMNNFLKARTYSSFHKTGPLTLPDEKKEELSRLVQNILTKNVPVKVPRQVFTINQLDAISRALASDEKRKKTLISMEISENNETVEKSTVLCSPKDTYFIISSSISKSLNLVEWILIRGGRKLVLAVSNQNGSDQKLNRLIEAYEAEIFIFSTKTFRSSIHTTEMIDKIQNLGPPLIIFSLFSAEKLVRQVTSCLPNLVRGVTISEVDDTFIADENNNEDLKWLTIICKDDISYLNILDQAIIAHSSMKEDLYYLIEGNCLKLDVKTRGISPKEFLPKSFECLEEIGFEATSFSEPDRLCARFKEIQTISPPHNTSVSDVAPVFMISSSPSKMFKKMYQKLIYPLYFARFAAEVPSSIIAAKQLHKSLAEIHPAGPCTIVAETLLVETAAHLIRLLKESGRNVSIVLLPALPKILKSSFSSFEKLDDVLLRNVLHITEEEYHDAYSKLDLDSKLAKVQKKGNTSFNRDLVLIGIKTFLNQIELFKNALLPSHFLQCPVTIVEASQEKLIRKPDYAKISKDTFTVHRIPVTTYEEFLADASFIELLNKEHTFSWARVAR